MNYEEKNRSWRNLTGANKILEEERVRYRRPQKNNKKKYISLIKCFVELL